MALASELIGFGNVADRPEPGVTARLWSDGNTVWRDSGQAWEVYARSAPPTLPLNAAAQVGYSNTVSGLSATNVQDAIDELFAASVEFIYNLRVGKTAGFTVVAGDKGNNFHCTSGTFTIALTAAATLGANFVFAVFNSGSGVITIDPNSTETIRDAAGSATTKTLTQGQGGIIFCDGSNFFMLKVGASGSSSADLITFDPSATSLVATDVQAAIEELEGLIGGPSAPVVDTTILTGNQDNYDFGGANILVCNNTTDLTIRGLLAGVDGQVLRIWSKGNGNVFVNHQDVNSTAANRILNAYNGPIPLAATKGYLDLVYDGAGGRWRVLNHEQGAPIAVAHSAGNFTGSGSLSWTVDSGDQVTFKYLVRGTTMTLFLQIDNTSISGSGAACQITIPLGVSAGSTLYGTVLIQDNTVFSVSQIQVAGGTLVYVYKDFTGSNWTGGANVNSVRGQFTFDLA